MKRANGMGSVYRLSGNRRNPWVASITLGQYEGKLIRKTLGYFPDRPTAEKEIALYRNGGVSDYTNITLAELYDLWKQDRAFTELSKPTKDNYEAVFKHYMKDFHNVKFASLRLPQFQIMIDEAIALNRSRSTLQKIKILSGLLSSYANILDIIPKSYAVKMRLPKEQKNEMPTFTDIEIQKLFSMVDVPLVDTILIFIFTGMRIAELLQLTRFDVDIKNMIITVGVKTDAERNRIIPIHPKIQALVKKRYDESYNFLIERDKSIGNKKSGTNKYVKAPYSTSYYRDQYYLTLEKVGIRKLSPHKARHTFFTMLSAKCTDKKAMALVGGYTDTNFIDKVYVHPDIERLRRAIESI